MNKTLTFIVVFFLFHLVHYIHFLLKGLSNISKYFSFDDFFTSFVCPLSLLLLLETLLYTLKKNLLYMNKTDRSELN